MKLNGYMHKPEVKFQGSDDYYLGMELEIEAPSYNVQNNGLSILKRPQFCHAKTDGSLGEYGWELVTQPIARLSWLEDETTLPVGTIINKTYVKKGQRRPAPGEVPPTDNSPVKQQIRVERAADGWLYEGKTYKSLTRIAKIIVGNKQSISGPAFFGILDNAAKKTMRLVKQLKEIGYDSHNGGRCGMHFHVSRTAFKVTNAHGICNHAHGGCLNNVHVYFFARLINGELFAKLSQRQSPNIHEPFHYCQQGRPTLARPIDRNTRYVALNGTNYDTIEVRIFRGNMREDRIRKNVEAVIAAVEFSRGCEVGEDDEDRNLDAEFVKYVKENKKVYPNLTAYLEEMDSPRLPREGEVVSQLSRVGSMVLEPAIDD